MKFAVSRTGGSIRLCTYNVNNLFLKGEGALKPHAQTRALVRMLSVLDADVVCLQEVGSMASLLALNEGLDHPYPFSYLLEGNSNRSIHLATLSRVPCQVTSHRQIPLQDEAGHALKLAGSETQARAGQLQVAAMTRDLIRIDLEGLALSVFHVHLKSRLNQPWQVCDAATIRRAEVALVVDQVQRFQSRESQQGVVLAGDFNDRPSSDELAGLQALGFTDVHGELLARRGRNPSTYWPKRNSRFDRLLLNDVALARYAPDSVALHATQMARQASDHYPVTLDLNL